MCSLDGKGNRIGGGKPVRAIAKVQVQNIRADDRGAGTERVFETYFICRPSNTLVTECIHARLGRISQS